MQRQCKSALGGEGVQAVSDTLSPAGSRLLMRRWSRKDGRWKGWPLEKMGRAGLPLHGSSMECLASVCWTGSHTLGEISQQQCWHLSVWNIVPVLYRKWYRDASFFHDDSISHQREGSLQSLHTPSVELLFPCCCCSCVHLLHCVLHSWEQVPVRCWVRSQSQRTLPTALLLSAGRKGLSTQQCDALDGSWFPPQYETCNSLPPIPPTFVWSPKKDKLRYSLWVMCSEILSASPPPEYPQ